MNMMKSGLLMGLLLTIGSIPSVWAADVTITVNGKVVARPCTVTNTDNTVDLGNLYTSDFYAAGDVSPWMPVTLSLTNCPVGTSQVTAAFSGTPDSTGNYYANQGAAGNVALQLAEISGTNVPNGTTKKIAVNYPAQTWSYPLQVRAITVNGNATQGTIQAVVNVTFTYE